LLLLLLLLLQLLLLLRGRRGVSEAATWQTGSIRKAVAQNARAFRRENSECHFKHLMGIILKHVLIFTEGHVFDPLS
jgi:hypothetical protein